MNSILPFILSIIILTTCSCNKEKTKTSVCYDYLTYLPPKYSLEETKEWPLLIFLHGASLRGNDLEKIKKYVDQIKSLTILIFHGAKDNVYSVKESDMMYKLLKDINPKIKYTRYPDLGHGATHDTTYKSSELYEWFLSNTKN